MSSLFGIVFLEDFIEFDRVFDIVQFAIKFGFLENRFGDDFVIAVGADAQAFQDVDGFLVAPLLGEAPAFIEDRARHGGTEWISLLECLEGRQGRRPIARIVNGLGFFEGFLRAFTCGHRALGFGAWAKALRLTAVITITARTIVRIQSRIMILITSQPWVWRQLFQPGDGRRHW